MKICYRQNFTNPAQIEDEYSSFNLKDAIEKTRVALDIAYAGFDNATDVDLIDSYIYEINSLQKRYHHLTTLAEETPQEETIALRQHSPIRALVSHVFG